VEGSVVQPLFSCRVARAGSSHIVRRIVDGVSVRIQGKARGAGKLRVALFPSKHSRVRLPRPQARESRHPLSQPKTRRPGLRRGGQHRKRILSSEGQSTHPGPFTLPHRAHPDHLHALTRPRHSPRREPPI